MFDSQRAGNVWRRWLRPADGTSSSSSSWWPWPPDMGMAPMKVMFGAGGQLGWAVMKWWPDPIISNHQLILMSKFGRYWNIHEYLVAGLEHFSFFHIGVIVITIDFQIFQRGRSTTNQSWSNIHEFMLGIWKMLEDPPQIRSTSARWGCSLVRRERFGRSAADPDLALWGEPWWISSGNNSHGYGKSPYLLGKLTISMAMFHSYLNWPEGVLYWWISMNKPCSTRHVNHVFFPHPSSRSGETKNDGLVALRGLGSTEVNHWCRVHFESRASLGLTILQFIKINYHLEYLEIWWNLHELSHYITRLGEEATPTSLPQSAVFLKICRNSITPKSS